LPAPEAYRLYPLALVKVVCPEADKVVNAPVLAAVDPIALGEANVAPFKLEAFRFATLVVDATENGAVPVVIVDIICAEKVCGKVKVFGP